MERGLGRCSLRCLVCSVPCVRGNLEGAWAAYRFPISGEVLEDIELGLLGQKAKGVAGILGRCEGFLFSPDYFQLSVAGSGVISSSRAAEIREYLCCLASLGGGMHNLLGVSLRLLSLEMNMLTEMGVERVGKGTCSHGSVSQSLGEKCMRVVKEKGERSSHFCSELFFFSETVLRLRFLN